MPTIRSDLHTETPKSGGGIYLFLLVLCFFFFLFNPGWFWVVSGAIVIYFWKRKVSAKNAQPENYIDFTIEGRHIEVSRAERPLWRTSLDNLAWAAFDQEKNSILLAFEDPANIECLSTTHPVFQKALRANAANSGAHLSLSDFSLARFQAIKRTLLKSVFRDN